MPLPRLRLTGSFGLLALGSLALSSCAPTVTQNLDRLVPGSLAVAQPAPTAPAGTLLLNAADFRDSGSYPLAHVGNSSGCTGSNLSPALNWSGAPTGTVSYVLTNYDPDAPTGSGFWHWAVYNIPASVTSLAEGAGNSGGSLPAGAAQLNNDAGQPGFAGACPPVGDKPHRYIFTLYALNKTLNLPPNVSPAVLGFNLNGGAVLAKRSITAFYGR